MKYFSIKRLVLSLISFAIALTLLLGLFAPFVGVSISFDGMFADASINGFSNIAPSSIHFGEGYYYYAPPILTILSWLVLICSAVSLITIVTTFFTVNDRTLHKILLTFIIICLVVSVIYLVLGIITVTKINDYLDIYLRDSYDIDTYNLINLDVFTKTYIPLIFVVLLFVGYIVVNKVMPSSNNDYKVSKRKAVVKMSEDERLAVLLKYKQLLDEEIINKEEFEKKKKTLLLLEEDEYVAPKTKPVSSDDIKIESIKKYKKLLDDGLITEEEFTAFKSKLL